jgi:hypothetical protein
VLRELEEIGVDEIACLGDIAVGPQPVESTERRLVDDALAQRSVGRREWGRAAHDARGGVT